MRSQVVSMVDAMASFSSTGVTAGDAQLNAPTTVVSAPLSNAGAGVIGMVDAMKQFDANGQPKLANGLSSDAIAATLNTTAVRKPDTDILASGK